ncbi:uroporphyrinogen-III synthase [Curvibacter sp. CHRR-16]|uniref:uroporphyrinogen-III synthase n=1 Tax=Curvibacter sp. CHRR-16 TaxID=2835872 RepID=UPI001BDA0CD9|nr:uroporphyrinogen-III synthase [Curvibacter sp. CHRR-16]MBT0571389.1 uroporphyrinogen-III synthase [Curvibacter sp. CHRR-16]
MRVILTRPAGQSAAWLPVFQQAGLQVEQWPLIALCPVRDAAAQATVRACAERVQQGHYHAVMFVSRMAVQALWALAAPQPWPCMAWSTGPGTRQALLECGVGASRIVCPPDTAAQFDSEALWALVGGQVQHGWRVLIVRGQDEVAEPAAGDNPTPQGSGRDWLAQQLHAAGATVDWVVAYERSTPVWTAAQQEQAVQALADGQSVWVFSSSQALRHLHDLLPPKAVAQHAGTARAVVTHERIAQQALACGWQQVVVSKPLPQAVWRAMEGV